MEWHGRSLGEPAANTIGSNSHSVTVFTYGDSDSLSMLAMVKQLHIALAAITFGGFLLRCYWRRSGNPWLDAKPVRVLPHVIDTLFLASGIALAAMLSLNPLRAPWLLAKLIALVVYIGAGSVAIRRGRTAGSRRAAFVVAVVAFAYIVGAARFHSPGSWLA